MIERLGEFLPAAKVAAGIGDDAAVLPLDDAAYLLATVDMLVENVHFTRTSLSAFDLGRRAIAVSLSDIAAMGGEPTFALVSLAAPPTTYVEFIEDIYRGIRATSNEYATAVVGGNVSRTAGPFTIDVVLLGTVPQDQVLLRRGGLPGDLLVVTGQLGSAMASRLVRERPTAYGDDLIQFALRHAVPVPRLQAARELADTGLVHAMLDISDGLASDAGHLAKASSVGVTLYETSLPMAPETVSVSVTHGMSSSDFALSGGEDYELLFAIEPKDLERTKRFVRSVDLTVVGSLHSGDGTCQLQRIDGSFSALEATGWAHF